MKDIEYRVYTFIMCMSGGITMNCKTTTIGGGHCGPDMNCGCFRGGRRFHSKEERIEMLERYRKELEKEIQGLDSHLQELRQES